MALQQFSLVSPNIQSGQLFQSLVTALPPEVIEQVIDQTGTREQRSRLLPTQLVVCLIIALSLWSHDSMKDVLKNLLDGWGQKLLPLSQRWHIPGKTAITKARQRVGPRVMSTLFQRLCRPMATPETPGAFLQGLRLVGVDGTSLDLPDSPANARVFGYPSTRPSTRAAFPKVRLVLLVELGTHLVFDALLGQYRHGERRQAQQLLRSVGPGLLVMWHGGLHSYTMVQAAQAQGSHVLRRVPAHVKLLVEQELPDGSYFSHLYPPRQLQKQGHASIAVRVIPYTMTHTNKSGQPKKYRLITTLLDSECFAARLLATEFHRQWEEELTIDELKTHLLGRKLPIRSENPREVVQEICGLLLGHWAVRRLMVEAAQSAQIAPLLLSFTASVKVIRRAVPEFQRTLPEQLELLSERLVNQLLDEVLPERENRSNPRVVKKRVSKYRAKKVNDRTTRSQREPPKFPFIATVSA